jgi:hypothetical protein
MSLKGIKRPLDKSHQIIGKVEEIRDEDVIDIWYTDDPKGLESSLIKYLKPKYNGGISNGKRCWRCSRLNTSDKEICLKCFEELTEAKSKYKKTGELPEGL